jgi:FAD/FMN-containing dehydrogenase
VDRETQAFGLAVAGGIVSTTGVAGLTLGGGQGWLRRKHGMTIDDLVGVDIVTADGEFRHASEAENGDLFWAVRGGEGNFGVVTSFEFRLHPVGPMVMLSLRMYEADRAREALRFWDAYISSAPDEVSSNALIWTVPSMAPFPPEAQGKRVIALVALHSGALDEGERVLAPLSTFENPVVDLTGPIPYAAFQSANDAFFPKRELLYYWKSIYLASLSDDVIDALLAHESERPSALPALSIWAQGGAMRWPREGTTLGPITAPHLLEILAKWSDPAGSDAHIRWTRDIWRSMHRFSSGATNLNFPGLGEEGEELVRAGYEENYDRLVALKTEYDPANLFRINQNIKPAG